MLRRFSRIVFITLVCIVTLLSLYDFVVDKFSLTTAIGENRIYRNEQYDPQLLKLNTVSRLEFFCDSVYRSRFGKMPGKDKVYLEIVIATVRNRFYHGYQSYRLANNFIAYSAAKISGRSYDATLYADDLLKFSEADCRQHCLVMMDLLKRKGYDVRAVYLRDNIKYPQEHFAFEAFYEGGWHFFDPDMEPNTSVLVAKNRPSADQLSKDSDLLSAAYVQYDKDKMFSLFRQPVYGEVNHPIPQRLYIFHSVTKFASRYLWIGCLVFFFFYFKRNAKTLSVPVAHPMAGSKALA